MLSYEHQQYVPLGSATATAHASANTKGSWTQVVASTERALYGIWWQRISVSQLDTGLMDIGIGGAGSEQIVIPDLTWGENGGGVDQSSDREAIFFPCLIPAGTRVASRTACSVGGRSLQAQIAGCSAPINALPNVGRWTAYGIDATNSRGSANVTVPASGTGAWAEVVASTTNPTKLLVMQVSYIYSSAIDWAGYWEVGVGGAGSEAVLMRTGVFIRANQQLVMPSHVGPFPLSIPAGSRISLRLIHSGAGSISGTFYGSVLCGD